MKLWTIGVFEWRRISSHWTRLKRTTWSELKRRKARTWAGFGSVTVRFGSPSWPKRSYSMDQNTFPHARLSDSTVP